MNLNQDYVLSNFRANTVPLYSIKEFFGETFVWLSINKNLDWFWPEIKNGKLIGIRSIGMPLYKKNDITEQYDRLNYQFKYISPKHKNKIENTINQYEKR